jgi:putative peptidoglycan binding protein
MRNRLLVSAAILVAGVAIASAQHAPQHAPGGAGQPRSPARIHDARIHDVSRPHSGQSRRSPGDVTGKSAQPLRTRTASSPQGKGAGLENPQKPWQRAAAKRGPLTTARHNETLLPAPRSTRERGDRHNGMASAGNHGAKDHARNQATRRPPEHAMGRAGEREVKAQPRTVKTGKVRAGSAAPQTHPHRDSASHAEHTDISKVQTALNQQGFNVGDPDGKLGQRTKKALIAFQKQHGFLTTGRVDRATLQALNAGGGDQAASKHNANKTSANKDGNQKRGPAPAAAAPQNVPTAPSTTGQGGAAPAPATASPQPVDEETPAAREGLQMPDGGNRVPAGAPQEDYKDDALPSGGDQQR